MAKAIKSPATVLTIALNEEGYLEKKSLNSLDDKKGNAGYNNFTKYWRDLYPQFQGQPWCACFCAWVFIQAYGKEEANKMLCGNADVYYCPTIVNNFKRGGRWYTQPAAGDYILFKDSSGVACHVGIVEKVDSVYIYTIEGNTSSGIDTVEPNGGAVARKMYLRSNSRILGFGRPKYDNENSIVTQVQEAVGLKTKIDVAYNFDRAVAGKYIVTASSLRLRSGAGTDKTILKNMPNGTVVKCYGYYNVNNGVKWFYLDAGGQVGYASSTYLKKMN